MTKKTAPQFLNSAAEHLTARASLRDQPEGERSMARTVAAFNALTGHKLSERDGWLFMVQLKAARAATTPNGIADDYEDGAAYFALAGEAACGDAWNDNVEAAPISAMDKAIDGTISRSAEQYPWGSERIPVWARYVAQEATGNWYAYQKEPRLVNDLFRWMAPGGRVTFLGTSSPARFRASLRKVVA